MLPVDYLCGARRDFDESFDWYAARSTPTALRFVAAVDAAVTSLADDPMRFASPDCVHHESRSLASTPYNRQNFNNHTEYH